LSAPIADPARRAILCLLAVGVMAPTGLAGHFKTSRQAVSKHLQILVECELLKAAQDGREIRYHLNLDGMQEVEQWWGNSRSS
jgi:DNA-binding transcriptional ArsR family regulator